MFNNRLLIAQLRQRLQTLTKASLSFVQLVQPLHITDDEMVLTWLNSQSLFPCFYWVDRENKEEVAACGAVIDFSNWAQANHWLTQNPECACRLWGLNAFDHSIINRNKPIFLPRFELMSNGRQLIFKINLYAQPTLSHDITKAIVQLDALNWTSKPPMMQAISVLSTQHQPDQLAWQQLLKKALTAIEQKQLMKVVLARQTELTLDRPLNVLAFMMKSRQMNSHCYHFLYCFDEQHAFLGATPERLFLREKKQLLTEALAGTVANSTDPIQAKRLRQWLQQDKKNKLENKLVVDDICQRLASLVQTIDIKPLEIVRLRNVQHLRHMIQAQLAYIDDYTLLCQLQPTAAVAGLPRQKALKFILDNEPFQRGWYAGSVGYMSKNRSEFAVTLRSARIKDKQLYLYAGAGIVEGSQAQSEWQELENKAAALRTLLM